VQASLGDWPRDAEGKPTHGVTLEQLDSYWNEAKASGEPSTT